MCKLLSYFTLSLWDAKTLKPSVCFILKEHTPIWVSHISSAACGHHIGQER